ncbi:MAG: hypothetical protein U9R06_03910, partial [Patescibacteria group bacterium]|nr:hypothetical protein [Patescibacteria group bacterium]
MDKILPKDWKLFKLIKVAPVLNKRVTIFEGDKKYIATGSLSNTRIKDPVFTSPHSLDSILAINVTNFDLLIINNWSDKMFRRFRYKASSGY